MTALWGRLGDGIEVGWVGAEPLSRPASCGLAPQEAQFPGVLWPVGAARWGGVSGEAGDRKPVWGGSLGEPAGRLAEPQGPWEGIWGGVGAAGETRCSVTQGRGLADGLHVSGGPSRAGG